MVAAGVAIAALALMVALWSYLYDDSPTTPVSLGERPVAAPGCFGCLLASEAGDDYLRRHLERECAA
jgi:hypothetical protein